jgi:hypothetical protein
LPRSDHVYPRSSTRARPGPAPTFPTCLPRKVRVPDSTCRSFGRADVDTSLDGRGRAQPFGGGRTFGARNATTGSSAVSSVRGRWPSSRRRCYRPGLRWPVGGPRKTFRGRLRALSLSRRPNWGDCRQCPLTAALQRAGVPESYLASVANRSVTLFRGALHLLD